MAWSITRWGGLIWDWWIEIPVIMKKYGGYYPRAVKHNLGCVRAVFVRLWWFYTYTARKLLRAQIWASRDSSGAGIVQAAGE